LESLITGKTKALSLNSPSNPTGSTYDRKSLERIAEIVLRHNLYVVSDEIYEKLVYDDAEHVSIASLGNEIRKRTIVVNGLSKSHAMTGWRVGFAAGPREIIRAMTNIQSQSTSNPNSIAQKAALEALTGPQDFIGKMRSEFDRRRKFLVEGLNSIPDVSCGTPTGAFYAFPNISGLFGKMEGKPIFTSSDLALYLLDNAGVALVPGDAFGDNDYIRLSYATSMENLRKGVDRIRDAVGRLK
jgi:aspartate aminotransferase